MNFLINFLLTIFIIVCLLLVLVVLLQRPRSEGLGTAFASGMVEQFIGPATSVLVRFTTWMGGIFFLLTIILAYLYAHQYSNKTTLGQNTRPRAQATASPSAAPMLPATTATLPVVVPNAATPAASAMPTAVVVPMPSVGPTPVPVPSAAAVVPAPSAMPAASATPAAEPLATPTTKDVSAPAMAPTATPAPGAGPAIEPTTRPSTDAVSAPVVAPPPAATTDAAPSPTPVATPADVPTSPKP